MTQYNAIVRFEREYEDDASAIGKEQPTAKELAIQLATELQEGFDMAAIAGQFQVTTVELNGIAYPIESKP